MFKIFKKKTEKEKLEKQYETYLKEAHTLSTKDRLASDEKVALANAVLEKLKAIQ